MKASIFTPSEYIGHHHGAVPGAAGHLSRIPSIWTPTGWNCTMNCRSNEIVYDFFDALKSRTRGYASFDYELTGYQPLANW